MVARQPDAPAGGEERRRRNDQRAAEGGLHRLVVEVGVEARAQPRHRLLEASRDGGLGDAQLRCELGLGGAAEVAAADQVARVLGQRVERGIELGGQRPPGLDLRGRQQAGIDARIRAGAALVAQRDVQRHSVQPGRERVADRTRLLGEGEEALLGGVLGSLAVSQDADADAEHHAAVPADELGEGVGIALARIAGEQEDIIHGR